MEVLELKKHIEQKSPASDSRQLYETAFPIVAKFISKMGGSFDDAKDIFHDALVIYYELKNENKLRLHSTEEAYILGIAKHLWVRKFNASIPLISFSASESQIQLPDDYVPTVNQSRLLRYLENAGKKCMDLLRAFYFQKNGLRLMAKNLNYSGEHSLSAQKYKCLEKVRNVVKEKSLTYDDFLE
jgi:hypothetical protein